MIPCIAIVGPTASGKSSLGFRLAEEIGGTIISADSMQIYRGMDIGTAKPGEDERKRVPHKMIDLVDPEERYSVYEYQSAAENEIRAAWSDSSVPIVVGGTGLYVDALIHHTDFGKMEIDPAITEGLNRTASSGRTKDLLDELARIDPECAAPLHERDVKRIVRALAVYRATGRTLTSFKKDSHGDKGDIDYLLFYLCFHDRAALYKRIDERVDAMIGGGLVSEAQRLYENGLLSQTTASQAIGYKEFLPYFTGTETLDACVSLLKQKTRNYAKRQITWFKRYTDAVPLYVDGPEEIYPILKERSVLFVSQYES